METALLSVQYAHIVNVRFTLALHFYAHIGAGH